jgi:sugar O-acyltransferase (sialic acid O-acetyltransferase NeuD family)
MATAKYILVGGAGHARVIVDCLQDGGHEVLALFDPKYDGTLYGVPQCGDYDPAAFTGAVAIIAVGDNAVRSTIVPTIKHNFANAIHSSAIVSQHARVGIGNVILHGVIVQAATTIGDHVILNTGAQVDHDCVVSDFAHIAPGAILCGNVFVGEGAFVGAGAKVIPGKKIGAWATIGAGAVVVDDIPDYAVAVGNPARIIKSHQP